MGIINNILSHIHIKISPTKYLKFGLNNSIEGMQDIIRLRNKEEKSVEAILQSLECANLQGRTLDHRFLIEISPLATEVSYIKEEIVQLSKLIIIEYFNGGWRPVSVANGVVSQYLSGYSNSYRNYMAQYSTVGHNVEKLKKLRESIIANGYPSSGWIVTFGDEPYIRDGQHRAAILYNLYGDIDIPILNFEFSPTYQDWRMRKPQFPLRNLRRRYLQHALIGGARLQDKLWAIALKVTRIPKSR